MKNTTGKNSLEIQNESESAHVSAEIINEKILLIRGKKVMLDSDLAVLYEVDTKRINEQIKRNSNRFPEDFMFQLTKEEWFNLKSQNATSSWGGRRKLPNVFTEHGILMLSSVLNSEKAIVVNIKIMRVYSKIKQSLLANSELLYRIKEIEKKVGNYKNNIELIFHYLDELRNDRDSGKPRTKIGYKK